MNVNSRFAVEIVGSALIDGGFFLGYIVRVGNEVVRSGVSEDIDEVFRTAEKTWGVRFMARAG